ncbi:hypothetical protein Bpfe_020260 [Biomphalaria pfeifferi]|uniref:Uncharacterized protein n=1 Tax=Biomphalaria pfeifferi TaxID=112525 RepID=A0AAD8F4V0_BIOPF|nr:hypothetical protein Bpfe_020260 [Biomphalaria pfeifferi]
MNLVKVLLLTISLAIGAVTNFTSQWNSHTYSEDVFEDWLSQSSSSVPSRHLGTRDVENDCFYTADWPDRLKDIHLLLNNTEWFENIPKDNFSRIDKSRTRVIHVLQTYRTTPVTENLKT